MRMSRVLMPILTLALLAPVAASAQQEIVVARPRGEISMIMSTSRGMLGIMTEGIPDHTPNTRQRLVVDVVADGPAEKAGVLRGDTLLSINGLPASQQILALPFEPGDTVVLRIRRDGQERDITVVAAERTERYRTLRAFPDSVGERMSIIMDRVRSNVEGIELGGIMMPELRITGDSVAVVVMGNDTIRVATAVAGARPFMHMDADSVRAVWGQLATPRIFSDSADSVFVRSFTWSTGGDSTFFKPFDVLTTTTTLGMRAVAGAELAPLNPGLAEYFGATDGVLVIDARDGTPAARAGLRAGDVITHVDGQVVTSIQDVRSRMARSRSDVAVRVLRSGRIVDLTIKQ